jgi:hypothetical protein
MQLPQLAQNSGVKWVIAIVIIYTLWYVVSKRDQEAGNWLVVLILLSVYVYQRQSVNAEFKKLGLLK